MGTVFRPDSANKDEEMKAEISSPKAVFVPVGINITMETQEDLDKFYTLFHHDFARSYFGDSIAGIQVALEEAGAHRHHYEEFIETCMKNNLKR